MRINYTTYDNRREEDIVNPRTRPDVMVLSAEAEESEDYHPYWYARIIDIFHVHVWYVGPASRSSDPEWMELLYVRWFGRDLRVKGGWQQQSLHRIGFVPESDPAAFGFLDPSQVIRGVHLIPAFAWHTTTSLMGPSAYARQYQPDDEDWLYYYVGMYV